MKNISRLSFINLIIFLIPISFLFHYMEISIPSNGSIFAFSGSFLFIILAGIVSRKIKISFIFIISFCSSLLSIVLGRIFITSPNESWFNPFGMDVAMILTSFIILTGILIIRFFSSKVLK